MAEWIYTEHSLRRNDQVCWGKARKHHFFNCIRLQLIAEHLQAACLHPFWTCKSGLRASRSTYGSWEFFASIIVLFEMHCVKRTVVHSLSLKHSYILPSCHKVNVLFTEQPPRVYGLLKLCIFVFFGRVGILDILSKWVGS